MHIITWVDFQGRYRVTQPAYNDPTNDLNSEFDMLAIAWAECRNIYGLPEDHPFFAVEDADQQERLAECCGLYFRYVARPDSNGERSAIGGAWEMAVDGRPIVNLAKARIIHAEHILMALEKEIPADPLSFQGIIDSLNLEGLSTPVELKAAWPLQLSEQV